MGISTRLASRWTIKVCCLLYSMVYTHNPRLRALMRTHARTFTGTATHSHRGDSARTCYCKLRLSRGNNELRSKIATQQQAPLTKQLRAPAAASSASAAAARCSAFFSADSASSAFCSAASARSCSSLSAGGGSTPAHTRGQCAQNTCISHQDLGERQARIKRHCRILLLSTPHAPQALT